MLEIAEKIQQSKEKLKTLVRRKTLFKECYRKRFEKNKLVINQKSELTNKEIFEEPEKKLQNINNTVKRHESNQTISPLNRKHKVKHVSLATE